MLVPKDGLRSIFVAWGKRGGTHNSTIFCIIPLDQSPKCGCGFCCGCGCGTVAVAVAVAVAVDF